MLEFKPVTKQEAPRLRRYYQTCEFGLCEYSVGTKLMWKAALHPAWAEIAGCLVVRNEIDGQVVFDYPVPGPEGDEDAALEAIENDCLERGIPPVISVVPECRAAKLLGRYPYVRVSDVRTWRDYVYYREDLQFFAGRRYSGQRNHINKFRSKWPDAQFRPLTAADAAATLRRAKSSQRYSARLAHVAAVSAGDGVVIVTLSRPDSSLPALLDIPIVKSGTEESLTPVGTGPYYFTTDEAGACLASHSGWWRVESRPAERIALSAARDREAILYQFSSHEVQLITADLIGTEPITATGNISYEDADTTVLQFLGFNTARAPFQDSAARRALGLGINRETLVSAVLSGHARAAQFPVSPVSPLYPAELESLYSYDDFAAAMEAAGLNTGRTRTVTLLVNQENTFKVSAAEHIAQALSDFDLQIQVEALPWEEYAAALAAGNFDLYYGEVRLPANWDLSALVGTGGSLNYGGWADPQTEQLLAACAAAEDRAAALSDLCAYLQQQAPILPLCFKSSSVLYQTGAVSGLTPTAAEPFYDLPSCQIHLRQP